LIYEKRGSREHGGWAPRFKTSPTTQTPLSCEILCLDCFQQAELDELMDQTRDDSLPTGLTRRCRAPRGAHDIAGLPHRVPQALVVALGLEAFD
jgi:hypothetical protein